MNFVIASILGGVQGITEFLPVSSTGHLILIGSILDWGEDFSKIFFVLIQIGSMAAIFLECHKSILKKTKGFLCGNKKDRHFLLVLVISIFPTVLMAIVFIDYIKLYLYEPLPVAIALIAGGFAIFGAENYAAKQSNSIEKKHYSVNSLEKISYFDALKIGLLQSFALIPGVSRSAATILGGLILGFHRRVAVEFSFFLAMPLLAGATLFDLMRTKHIFFTKEIILVFLIGFTVTFLFSFLSIRFFLRYLVGNDFRCFAWYRIILGTLIVIARCKFFN